MFPVNFLRLHAVWNVARALSARTRRPSPLGWLDSRLARPPRPRERARAETSSRSAVLALRAVYSQPVSGEFRT